jgi:drug/metabolite transporter (DMT)-like permease
VAVREVSPATLAFGRLLCSVVVLGSVAAARPAWIKGWRRYWRLSVAVALINYLAPYLLIAWGETRITSGMASILNATTPLFTVPLAARWVGPGHEPLTPRRVAGVVVGFVGVGVLVGPEALRVGGSTLGEIAVLVAAAAYGVGALLSRGYAGAARLVGPLGSQMAAVILVIPIMLVWTPPTHLPSWQAMGAIVTLGALGTAVAYLLYFWLIVHVGATRTTLVTYLLPCTALIWGVTLLGETVTWYAIAGLALVLAGTMVTNGTFSGLVKRRG